MAIYSGQLRDLVWRKGKIVQGYDPAKWRKDFAGAWMYYDAFCLNGEYGWEIEHIRPLSQGGEASISNLMPIHWRNNMVKANNFPKFKSLITSDGEHNIEREQIWVIQQ